MHASYHASFWIALLVGIASGSVGPFILLKRMALVGDALSHVALPGIALALLYGADPFYGVIVFLTAAAFLIFWLEGRSRIPPDAIVGLLFTASLAVGILIIPNAEIVESLFGAFPVLSLPFLFVILSTAAVLSLLCFVLGKALSVPDCFAGLGQGARPGPEVRLSAPVDLRDDRGFGDQVGWNSLDGRADDHSSRRRKERFPEHAWLCNPVRAAWWRNFCGRDVDG